MATSPPQNLRPYARQKATGHRRTFGKRSKAGHLPNALRPCGRTDREAQRTLVLGQSVPAMRQGNTPPRPRLHRPSSVTAAVGIVIATSAFHVQPRFLSSQFFIQSRGLQSTSFTRVVRRHRRVKLLYHSFSPLCKRPEGRIQVKFRENPSAPLHLRGGFHHIDVAAPRL